MRWIVLTALCLPFACHDVECSLPDPPKLTPTVVTNDAPPEACDDKTQDQTVQFVEPLSNFGELFAFDGYPEGWRDTFDEAWVDTEASRRLRLDNHLASFAFVNATEVGFELEHLIDWVGEQLIAPALLHSADPCERFGGARALAVELTRLANVYAMLTQWLRAAAADKAMQDLNGLNLDRWADLISPTFLSHLDLPNMSQSEALRLHAVRLSRLSLEQEIEAENSPRLGSDHEMLRWYRWGHVLEPDTTPLERAVHGINGPDFGGALHALTLPVGPCLPERDASI